MKEYRMDLDELEIIQNIASNNWVMKFWSHWIWMDTQERANDFWKKLWEKYWFDFMTVRPINWKSASYFTAKALNI